MANDSRPGPDALYRWDPLTGESPPPVSIGEEGRFAAVHAGRDGVPVAFIHFPDEYDRACNEHATHLLAAGTNLNTVAGWLGHAEGSALRFFAQFTRLADQHAADQSVRRTGARSEERPHPKSSEVDVRQF